jgi:hypothetical protein
MSQRRLAALGVVAVSATAVVLSTSPAFASSGDVLSVGAANPSGSNVAVGDTLTGSLASGTTNSFSFTSGGKTVTIVCTAASMSATDSSNPAAPGTADLSIGTLTFTSCTISGISGVTVSSVQLNGAASANVTSSPADFNVTALDERVALNNGLGVVNCDYGTSTAHSPIVGVISNPPTGTIAFTNQTVWLLSGTSVCGAPGSTGLFNMTLGNVVDATQSNGSLYAN